MTDSKGHVCCCCSSKTPSITEKLAASLPDVPDKTAPLDSRISSSSSTSWSKLSGRS